MSTDIKISGTNEFLSALRVLERREIPKLSMIAARKAMAPAVRSVKAKLTGKSKRSSGALKASIGLKSQRRGRRVNIYVGPRASTTREFDGRTRRPVRYAHLVEFGHRIVRKGQKLKRGRRGELKEKFTGSYVKARPFMAPVWSTIQMEAFTLYIQQMQQGVIAAAATAARESGVR